MGWKHVLLGRGGTYSGPLPTEIKPWCCYWCCCCGHTSRVLRVMLKYVSHMSSREASRETSTDLEGGTRRKCLDHAFSLLDKVKGFSLDSFFVVASVKKLKKNFFQFSKQSLFEKMGRKKKYIFYFLAFLVQKCDFVLRICLCISIIMFGNPWGAFWMWIQTLALCLTYLLGDFAALTRVFLGGHGSACGCGWWREGRCVRIAGRAEESTGDSSQQVRGQEIPFPGGSCTLYM